MKKHAVTAVLVIAAILTACTNSLLDQLPEKVIDFIEEYFPGEGVSTAEYNDGVTLVVRLHNSAIISFDKENNWSSVSGSGSTLPQMFLFDQLPPAFYQYLQETENLNGVYGVIRNNRLYRVELRNSSLIYNIEEGTITTP
ncbi:MAG: hypothetical protein K2O00_06035 [Muribaculaceae bacterium]|nr:hypothetical protein [Muribaculaceae bacterium]